MLENYIFASVKIKIYEPYKLIIEQRIEDKIGGMELDDLSPFILQQFISDLLQNSNKKQGKAFSQIASMQVISVLHSSFKTTHILGLTKEYTADKLKRPKPKKACGVFYFC